MAIMQAQPRRLHSGGVLAIGDRIGLPPDPGANPRIRTDLTSTPALFTWLVPKTGAHLPAALALAAISLATRHSSGSRDAPPGCPGRCW